MWPRVDLGKFFANAYRFSDYIVRIFYLDNGRIVFTDMGEWFWGLGKWLRQLLDTVLIAYLGTLLARSWLSAVLCAAANLAVSPARRFIARRFLEFCRTVPEIVFALIFVVAYRRPRPGPGVLAIMIHTVGALGKLFSEDATRTST